MAFNRNLFMTLDGNALIFDDKAGLALRIPLSTMSKLYHVRSGSDIYANDEEFWVLESKMVLVVIPDDETNVIRTLLQAWRTQVGANTNAYEAVCALPPSSWRIKRLRFLPSTKMKFSVFSLERLRSLEGWRVLGPLAFDLYCD